MRSNICVNEMALFGPFAALFKKGKIFLDSHGELPESPGWFTDNYNVLAYESPGYYPRKGFPGREEDGRFSALSHSDMRHH